MFTDTLLVFDNLRHRLLVIANAHVDQTDPASLDRAYDAAAVKIGMLLGKLRRPARSPAPLTLPPIEPLVALGDEGFTSTMDRGRPSWTAVRRTKEYIAAGDAYQVVLSRRLDTELQADPFTVYRALRTINPSPYLFFLRLGKTSIVGSSPEVLVRLEDGRVEERPIAGTHPRGADRRGGRRAWPTRCAPIPRSAPSTSCWWTSAATTWAGWPPIGTVEVTEFMVVERYSHVMHLVSHVRGQLAAGQGRLRRARRVLPRRDPDRARPRCAPWRSSRSSSRRGAAPTGARSATSPTRATSTPASRSAPWSATAAAPPSRSAPASWPTPIRRRSGSRPASKARGMILALRIAAQESPR